MPRLIDADATKNLIYISPSAWGRERDLMRVIDSVPTIDAEPVRHGRWILKAHDKRVNYLWTVTAMCSECCDEEKEIWSGYFPGVPDYIAQDVALDSAKTVKVSDYCPNCGAKMDLEVQDESGCKTGS